MKSLDAAEINPAVYDSPNWAHKQADTNGMKRGLKFVSDLLNFQE